METAVKRKADAVSDENANLAKKSKVDAGAGATAASSSNPVRAKAVRKVAVVKKVVHFTVGELRSMLKEGKPLTDVKCLIIDDDRWSSKATAKSYDDVLRNIPSLLGLIIENSKKFPIEEFCKLNPQLKFLKLKNGDWRIRSPLLAAIDKALPELKVLEIQFQFAHNDDDYGAERFKNLESLDIYAEGKSYGRALAFLNSPAQLKSLSIGGCNGNVDKLFFATLKGYKSLKNLTILSWLENKQLAVVADNLPPSVEVLHFQGGKVGTNGVVDLIKKCKQAGKQLRKIEISPGCKKVYEETVEKFCTPLKKRKDCAGWNIGDDGGGVIILEKKPEN